MCLAIYKPAAAKVEERYLRNGFANHEDGAGFAWAVDGVLHVKKGIFDVDELLKQYEEIKNYPCLIHFRKATHGHIDENNCHPFVFNDGKLALIHNGILQIKCNIEGLSDTAHFVKLVLEPMVKKYNMPIKSGALKYLIETSIGSDKMVVMDGTGESYIFNEEKGKWDDGVWYSNHSYSYSYNKNSTYGGTTTYHGNGTTSYQSNMNYQSNSNYQGNTCGKSSAIGGTSSKKSWEDTVEDNSSYMEFFKKNYHDTHENAQSTTDGLTESVDAAGNVIIDVTDETKKDDKTFGPGDTCEYGYWDEEIEADIKAYMTTTGRNRQESIVEIFSAM